MVALPPKNTLLFLRLLKQYLGLFWRERPRKKRLPATFLFFLVLWRQMRGKKVSFLLLPLLTSVETTRKASSFVATSDDDDDDDDGARAREREREREEERERESLFVLLVEECSTLRPYV